MIRTWQHKGLKNFYDFGSKAGIQPKHAETLSLLLLQLTSAIRPEDMNTPVNHFHMLIGDLKNLYSVKVDCSWRIIFQFVGEDAILVDYINYH